MTTIIVPRNAKLPINTRQWARNTRAVAAEFQNILAERVDYAGSIREGKCVFSMSTDIGNIPDSTSGTRLRWRFPFHAGPFAQYIRVHLLMARQNSGTAADCYVRCDLKSANGGTVIGRADRHFGSSATTPSDVPSEFGASILTIADTADSLAFISVTPDTDYTFYFSDVNYARLVSATVYVISLLPNTDNDYIPITTASGTPIYDNNRGDIAAMARLLHKRHAAQLLNYVAETNALAQTLAGAGGGATFTNLVDMTSTGTPTSATPGYTIDMRQRSTVRMAGEGVPIKVRVLASSTASDTGTLRLVDSSGTTMAEVDLDADGEAWSEVKGYLPASLAKYDVQIGGNVSALTVYSVGVYELDYTTSPTLAVAVDGTPEPVTTSATVTTTVSVTITDMAASALTLIVTATWSGGGTRPAVAPVTTDLDGWTAGTWATSGTDAWVITYTRASHAITTSDVVLTVGAGTTAGTVTFSAVVDAEIADAVTATADAVTINLPATLAYTIAGTPDPSVAGTTVSWSVVTAVGGVNQTGLDLTVNLTWQTGESPGTGPTTTDLAGWTQSYAWSQLGDVWYSNFTRSQNVGSTSLLFTSPAGALDGTITATMNTSHSDQVASPTLTGDTVTVTPADTLTATITSLVSVAEASPASLNGEEFQISVVVGGSTQNNVVITLTIPDFDPTESVEVDGGEGTTTAGALETALDSENTGWTSAVTLATDGTSHTVTFSRATLAVGTHTIYVRRPS